MENNNNPVRVQASFVSKVNFAGHQNAVPLLRDLRIENTSCDPLENLRLTISAHPAFLKERVWVIDRVAAESTANIQDSVIEYDASMLFGLNEAINADIRLVLTKGEGEVVAEHHQQVRVLARNEWGGSHFLPELLAAFVQPNDMAVETIQKRAAELLRKKDIQLDGYESGKSENVWSMLSAIWSAVAGLKLDYALPPASFEEEGQKVRTPSQVCTSGLATCLDSTLLFASVIEAVRLHPVVILIKGHAFVGCWLMPEEFKSAIFDDVVAVRKAVALDQLVLFETTLAVQHPPAYFSQAINQAKDAVSEEKEDAFLMVVDIKRSRIQRIFPLPTTEPVSVANAASSEGTVVLDVEAPPPLPRFDIEQEVVVETPQTRLNRWQRKLLDLSLRNKLLNFKPSKKAILLLCKKPALLEDLLAGGKEIKLSPLPDLTGGEGGRNEVTYSQMHGTSLTEEFVNEALERSAQVYAPLTKAVLESSLIELYRQAKLDIEEGGANTLFLAIGFLAWKKDAKDPKRYKAPLILIPVTLIRQGVGADMKLKLHDDEPRFNSSLMEMLKQDFEIELPNLETLPRDDSGIDVQLVWDKVKVAVHEVPGFEVMPEVALSTFSFAKYLMWKDLVDRTDQLKNNKVVAHLIDTPREAFVSDVEFVEPQGLDASLHPSQVFCPLPMDSSQLAAVIAAEKGKDFVLIGPPGTGKSQTISNMIAHLLAAGKTVLFVAEKSAALSVVYRRLSQQNLGEFCLELHSNKARKADVLAQLGRAWEANAEHVAGEWALISDNLKAQRDKLNSFVEHLHKVHGNGLSAYRAIGLSAFNASLFSPSLSWPDIHSHAANDYQALIELCEEMTVALQSAGGSSNPALRLIHAEEWAPSWQSSLIERANRLANAAIRLKSLVDHLGLELGVPLDVTSGHAFDHGMVPLVTALVEIPGTHLVQDLTAELKALREHVEEAQVLQAERKKLIGKLSVTYQRDIEAKIDVERLLSLHAEAKVTWWPKSLFRKHQAMGLVKPYISGKPDLDTDVDLIHRLWENRKAFSRYESLQPLFKLEWDGFDTDFEIILQRVASASAKAKALMQDEDGEDPVASYKESLSLFLSSHEKFLSAEAVAAINTQLGLTQRVTESIRQMGLAEQDTRHLLDEAQVFLADTQKLAAHTALGAKAGDVARAMQQFQEDRKAFESLAVGRLTETEESNVPWLSSIANTLQHLVGASTLLKSWCDWQKYRKLANARGLQSLVDAAESGMVPVDKLKDAFELGYAKWWLDKLVDEDEVLRRFSPAQHERIIDKFRELDDEYQALTRKYIRSLLAANKPAKNDKEKSKEFGVLQKELTKKSRHIPLRTLISKMPTGLTQLTPCLLMSPLSVAQYLPTDQALFDVVIFDEASQITVWDAVGAIARGKQAIIVGDPKQLPPTSFFGRADNDDLDEDVTGEDDLESILDEALGCRISPINLQWHYRSLHESLIAFSNHKYYGGNLVTFPAPTTEDKAVRFVEVTQGVYDKGNTRTNKTEAQAITEEILRRLNEWKLLPEVDRPSIGVVTFNSEQQSLIENMIETEVRKHPDLGWFFSEGCLEPVMVKNIENIQGDERDVMLFSITYGPDAAGKVSMNFGPMNRDGGERRLNVAVTRARREMIVYSTLGPEKIDLSRTQSIGVRDLKHFLEFAKHGPAVLGVGNEGSVGTYDSMFEVAVANSLSAKGWRVIPQIGVSSYRIDLGIVHPKHEGEFLCGVECDGATYHRGATARDRDKLREQILRGLGWNILRVWSTDWWIDAQGATEKLHRGLLALLETEQQKIALVSEVLLSQDDAGLSTVTEPE